ncbi:MAG: hypothetical protein ACC742_16220, partial [Thermoanaerobaculales bacterium]
MKNMRLLGSTVVGALVILGLGGPVEARRGAPPQSTTLKARAVAEVGLLELEAIDPVALLAEDKVAAALGPGPLRFASPVDVAITPAESGTWESLSDGGRLWRLRISSPNATDLNLGFTRFKLPPGATLHVVSQEADYYEGPYTFDDNEAHGELWTPVVPGGKAIVELYVPPAPAFEPELKLGRIGRGYRDLFAQTGELTKQGPCNIDVVCSEGNPWRNEIRSVGSYGIGTSRMCTGTMIMDVPGDFKPYFLSAYHCSVDESNDQSIVVYWNFESANCGDLSGGSLSDNQTGAIFRASRADDDFLLLELEEAPDQASNVYFAGWDARTSTMPASSVCIHHPNGDEKAISFNDDALTIRNNCILGGGPADTHWRVDSWEQGTTEPGSSGGGLWDPASHALVGYLSGGLAACGNSDYDCFGRFAIGWDGVSSAVRLRDWLDPGNTNTLTVAGANQGGGGGGGTECGNAAYDSGTSAGAAWFGGGWAGDPDYMYAVRFNLADFGYAPGQVEITSFCAANQKGYTGGPWPNEVFLYPDSGGSPDDSQVLGQGTIQTGDGTGPAIINLPSPVTLNGDFWLVNRGDPMHDGEDVNMEFDDTANTGHSFGSESGIANLALTNQGNFALRATL